jgi:glycosyltransferase involved in cell wall biosynthesis
MTAPSFTPPQPATLFCARAAPEYYRRPTFSARETFCSPDCEDVIGPDGPTALKVPVGEYDLATTVLHRLPADRRPELIVVKADATCGNLPRGLERFRCPKVLLVGDTHHFRDPVRALLRYAAAENFDFILLDHARHHGHFFLEAGFERVYWTPALDYVLRPRARPAAFEHQLTFVGQTGAFHPWRRHLLGTLVKAGLPLRTFRAPPERTADIYAASAVTLNCSLNGDLNLRVFEALGAGGFLLTDALTPESGLDRLFVDGEHLAVYRSPGELAEKARHYLDHPAEALRIRDAGAAHLLATQHPLIMLRRFYDLVHDDRVDPLIVLDDGRALPRPSRETLLRRAEIYEAVQTLHLRAARLTVLADPGDASGLALNARDLPRVAVRPWSEVAHPEAVASCLRPDGDPPPRTESVLALPWPEQAGQAAAMLTAFSGAYVAAPGRGRRDRIAAETTLAEWGFAPVQPGGTLFGCVDPVRFIEQTSALGDRAAAERKLAAMVDDADAAMVDNAAGLAGVVDLDVALRLASIARTQGADRLEEAFLRRCVALDRGHGAALSGLARLAEKNGRQSQAWLFAAEAARGRTFEPAAAAAVKALLDDLAAKAGDDPALQAYRAATIPAAARRFEPRRVLVATNLFPPQEFGGYGRKLWEFSAELRRRGHDVRVLTADAPEFVKPGETGSLDMEPWVERSLRLQGTWRDGRAHFLPDAQERAAIAAANDKLIVETAARLGSEVCLAGNVDLMSTGFLSALPASGAPLVHTVGNRHPGYAPADAPTSPLHRIAPASAWVGRQLTEAGFDFPVQTVIYPGARTDYFHRPFPPACDRLRIAYASLFVDYKGPQVLANALALLHARGVPFSCVFAGDTPDAALLGKVRDYFARQGFADRVRFIGFQDRRGLAQLFDRANVLVFPSVIDEAFGISQVEAMAAGVAVVSSGTGGGVEIIRDGVDGLLFRNGDHEHLADRLAGLAADPAGWARLAQAGQARAQAFTVAASVDRLEATFEALLALRATRGER